MKLHFFIVFYLPLLYFNSTVQAQTDALNTSSAKNSIQQLTNQFKEVELLEDKIDIAFKIVDNYISNDYNDSAQSWIYILIDLQSTSPNAVVNYFIHSRQMEIFYYSNLLQFGIASSKKGLTIAQNIGDSLLIADAYSFIGYIYETMDSIQLSKSATLKAKQYYPTIKKSYTTSAIKFSQIVNQLAQIYVKLKNIDSANMYNKIAYGNAIKEKAIRAQMMCLSTYADIVSLQNKKDSALYYLKQCALLNVNNENYDILLWNMGKQLQLEKNNPIVANVIVEEAFLMLRTLSVSSLFQKMFYKDALQVFTLQRNEKILSIVQKKLLELNEQDNNYGNKLIQDISEKYVSSENALLKSNVTALQNKKAISRLQLVSILSFALLSIGFVYYLYYKKKNKLLQIIKEQELLQLERNRIARDMHDDLGSGLTRIHYITQQALQQKDNVKEIGTIKSITTSLVESMREIIWAMKDDNNTIQELQFYIKEYAVNYCTENNIAIEIKMEEPTSNFKILGQNRRHIFLCIKETLHNVVKHSKASKVFLTIKFHQPNWQITVQDNGVGISTDNANSGYGLLNIAKRMAEVKGDFQYKTDNGFIVALFLPYLS